MATADERILDVLRGSVLNHIEESEWQDIRKAVVDAGGIRQVDGYARTVVHGAIEKARSFGGDRSQAGRYAATVRWMREGKAGEDAKRRAAGRNAALARFGRGKGPEMAAAGSTPPNNPPNDDETKKAADDFVAALKNVAQAMSFRIAWQAEYHATKNDPYGGPHKYKYDTWVQSGERMAKAEKEFAGKEKQIKKFLKEFDSGKRPTSPEALFAVARLRWRLKQYEARRDYYKETNQGKDYTNWGASTKQNKRYDVAKQEFIKELESFGLPVPRISGDDTIGTSPQI